MRLDNKIVFIFSTRLLVILYYCAVFMFNLISCILLGVVLPIDIVRHSARRSLLPKGKTPLGGGLLLACEEEGSDLVYI